ncbi:hypothetical protein CP533_1220 [Ophiocordyceps camponoti-saundersi (nom. inval.)]|nr:hypothetical protein CP533_1220 [Ophiocordyceps camponoti-saundersi (nom. inval.)]
MEENSRLHDTTPLAVVSQETYHYSNGLWAATPPQSSRHDSLIQEPEQFNLATYNVSDVSPDPSRYDAFVSSMLSPKAVADVLVLQAVERDFLCLLLGHADLSSRYRYCTHRLDDGSLTSIVVLSRLQFAWNRVLVEEKDKDIMAVLEFSQFRPSLTLVCCCLRGSETHQLLRYLATHHDNHLYIIAGHFSTEITNQGVPDGRIDSLFRQAGLQDSWLLCRLSRGESSSLESRLPPAADLYEGEEASTFNPLPQQQGVNDQQNIRPRRCGRILLGRNLAFRPSGFNMFGQLPPCISRHRGIRCLFLRAENMEAMEMSSPKVQRSMQTTDELKSTLARHGRLPTRSQDQQRHESLRLLERILLGSEPDNSMTKSPRILVIPIGSFGLGVWMSTSQLDCLCIGTMSHDIFFTIATQRLKAAGVSNLRRVKSAVEKTKLELHIEGIRFNLGYCVAPSIVESYPEVMKRPPTDSAFDLPTQTLARLKPVRDVVYLRRSIPDMAAFRLSHLLIRAWAESRGLYAPRFGLLGGFHITVMLVPVCKLLAKESGCMSSSDIIRSFFHHYATFDWRERLVFDPFFHEQLAYRRTSTEPLCLLGWHGPRLNAATHMTDSSVDTIISEFDRANSLLSQEGMTWTLFLDTDSPLIEFQSRYKSYINIEARYWATSPQKRTKFFRWLESRLSTFLLEADRILPTIGMRFWPARLVQQPCSIAADEFLRYYLIGLYRRGRPTEAIVNCEALQVSMGECEASIRKSSKYYDPNGCWVTASIVKDRDLPLGLREDSQMCSLDEETDDDDSMAEEDDNDDDDNSNRKPPSKQSNIPNPLTGRFRPASDVINRLRWDTALDATDYLIGYEDRFTGVREKDVDAWTSELTDDEFIPQHRIVYFKRKSDGRLVWDRRTRLDLLYKSGQ